MSNRKNVQLLDRLVQLAVFAGIVLIGVWIYNPGGGSDPSDNDFETLLEFSQVFTPFRMRLAEYYLHTGELATSNEELDFGPPESFRTEHIRSIGMTSEGILRVEFEQIFGATGAILEYRPIANQVGGMLRWECTSPNAPILEQFNFNCQFRPPHEMYRDASQ